MSTEPRATRRPTKRGVVGSVLDYRKMFEHTVGYEGGFERADIRAVNAQFSDTPMSLLGMGLRCVDSDDGRCAGGLH